jgi:hypothetical protein
MNVGAQGSSPLEMNPKYLMLLLQSKMEQQQQAQRQAARAAEGERARLSQEAILGQLSPSEKKDAQLYGLDYALKTRARREEESRLQQEEDAKFEKSLEGMDPEVAKQARLTRANPIAAQLMQRKEAERKANEEKQRRAQYILSQDAPRQAMQEGMRQMNQVPLMADPVQRTIAMGSIGQKMSVAAATPRVLDPWEEEALFDAKAPVPPGWIRRRDYEDQRIEKQQEEMQKMREEAKARETEAKNLIKQQEIAANMAILENLWKRTGDKGPVPQYWIDAVANGKDPYSVYEKEFGKEKAAAEKSSIADEKNRQRLAGLAAEYNKALTIYKGVDAEDQKAKVAAEAALGAAGDALKAEGVEPPEGFKPVNIYQFRKSSESKPAQESNTSGGVKLSPAQVDELKKELESTTDPKEKAQIEEFLKRASGGVGVAKDSASYMEGPPDAVLQGQRMMDQRGPMAYSMPTNKEQDNDLRTRQIELYKKIDEYNKMKEDAPRWIVEELNQIDAILKKRGYGSFHEKGIFKGR